MVDLLEQERRQDQSGDNDNKPVSREKMDEFEHMATEPDSDADTPFNYKKDDQSRNLLGLKKQSNGKLSTNKKIGLIAGAVGGIGIGLTAWFIIAVLGSLLVPQLAQHIIEYEFVNVTSQFADNAARVTDEKLAVDSIAGDAAGDKVYTAVEDEYGTGGASSLWSAFDNYRPNKVIANLENGDSGLSLNYGTSSILKRPVLESVSLGTDTFPIVQQGWTKYIPGVNSIIDFKNDVNLSKDFAPDLIDALKADNVGTIVRSIVAYKLRQELDVGLFAWSAGRLADAYQGKNPSEALNSEEQDKINETDEGLETDSAVTDVVKSTDTEVENTVTATESTAKGLESIEANNGIVPDISSQASAALASISPSTFVGFISPFYKIMLPLCIIYDGSLTNNSAPTIDNASDQQMRAFSFIESAADQEKNGSPTVNSEAVGALNNDLDSEGNIGLSNPELRADGDEVDTSNTISAESSPDGQFTLFNAVGLPSLVTDFMNKGANTLCPILTNFKSALAIAILPYIIGIVGGPEAPAVEGAVLGPATSEAVESTVAETGTEIAADEAAGLSGDIAGTTVSEAESEAANDSLLTRSARLIYNVKNLGKDAIKTAGQIAGLTLIAKVIVMSKASQYNSGTAQGIDLANEADSGGNIYANTISRNLNYGRPLDEDEVAQAAQSTQNDLVASMSKESVYQRYFALSNADSLFSHIGMDVYEHFNGSIFSSIINSIPKIFNPIDIISSVLSTTTTKVALAQTTVANSDYGNVQFGWSQSEENLINSSSSYMPLENQQILDESGEENAIAQTYGVCFTDTIGQLLSSNDPEYIVRDSKGNVVDDQGLCSPDNLSSDNKTLGPNGKPYGDLVFRWRLAMAYQNTLDQFDAESSLSN